MSYSLELEATSSIRMSSSDVRAASDAVTRLALDNTQQQQRDDDLSSSSRKHQSSSSPSPPPPPPPEYDSSSSFASSSSVTSSSVVLDPSSHSSNLQTTPAHSVPLTPQSIGQKSAPKPSMSPSRYPSFDQWLTVKESSFNFGLNVSPPAPPQSQTATPQLPTTSSRPQSADRASAAIRAVTSKAFAIRSQKMPSASSVHEADETSDPAALYMRAIALQQVFADKHSFVLVIFELLTVEGRLFNPFALPRFSTPQLTW